MFYQADFGDLRESQAHALLSVREYARLCGEALFKSRPDWLRGPLTRALAAFILSEERIVQFATNWSDGNFRRGTGSPRVRGTPFFVDVEHFAMYLDGMIDL